MVTLVLAVEMLVTWPIFAAAAEGTPPSGIRSMILLAPRDDSVEAVLPHGKMATAASVYLGDIGLSVVLGPPAPGGDLAAQIDAALAIADRAGGAAVVWYVTGASPGQILVHVIDRASDESKLTTFLVLEADGAERAIALKLRSLLGDDPIPESAPESVPSEGTPVASKPAEETRRAGLRLGPGYGVLVRIPFGLVHHGPSATVGYDMSRRIALELGFHYLGPVVHRQPEALGALTDYRLTLRGAYAFTDKRLAPTVGLWAALDFLRTSAIGVNGDSAAAIRVSPSAGLDVALEHALARAAVIWIRLLVGASPLRHVIRIAGVESFDSGYLSLGLSAGVTLLPL